MVQVTNSSTISGYEYDAERKILTVNFTKGTTYRYFDVPVEVYDGMTKAESIGKYFHGNIKKFYRAEPEK